MKEKAKLVLQNPELPREQCIEECKGCERMFSDENIGDVCVAYLSPKSRWSMYVETEYEVGLKKEKRIIHSNPCGLATHVTHEIAPIDKKWVNPQKASKRGNR